MTIPAITELLKDEDKGVRCEAASALGNMGPEAKTSIPALTNLLKDKDAIVRRTAVVVLAKIGPEAKTTIPAITKLLKDTDSAVRWDAAAAIGRIGPAATAAIPALIGLLKDEAPDVRCIAAWALGNMGPDAKTAIPALTELLKDRTATFDGLPPMPWKRSVLFFHPHPMVRSGDSFGTTNLTARSSMKPNGKSCPMPLARAVGGCGRPSPWMARATWSSAPSRKATALSTAACGPRASSSIPSATTSPAFNCRSSQGIGRHFG